MKGTHRIGAFDLRYAPNRRESGLGSGNGTHQSGKYAIRPRQLFKNREVIMPG